MGCKDVASSSISDLMSNRFVFYGSLSCLIFVVDVVKHSSWAKICFLCFRLHRGCKASLFLLLFCTCPKFGVRFKGYKVDSHGF